MIQRKLLIIIITLFVLVLAACSNQDTSKDVGTTTDGDAFVIKVGHAAAKSHFGHKTFEKFKEIVETK